MGDSETGDFIMIIKKNNQRVFFFNTYKYNILYAGLKSVQKAL